LSKEDKQRQQQILTLRAKVHPRLHTHFFQPWTWLWYFPIFYMRIHISSFHPVRDAEYVYKLLTAENWMPRQTDRQWDLP